MSATLTIFVPTTRPEGARRLAEAAYRLSEADTELIFIKDDTDTQVYDLPAGRLLECPPGERGIVHPLNWGLGQVELGEATGFFGDDVLPRTPGWDRKLLRQLRRQRGGLVYGNDQLQGKAIATHPIVSSNIPLELGWLAYPRLKHLCVDVVLHRMADDLGRCTYMRDVVLEHLHRANGKSPSDDTYEYVNGMAIQMHDGAVYSEYINSEEYRNDLSRLRAVLG
jgi:hypothetical protein